MAKSNRTINAVSLKALDAALAAGGKAENMKAKFITSMFVEGTGQVGDMVKSGATWQAPDGTKVTSTNDSDNAFFNPIMQRYYAYVCGHAPSLAKVITVMQSPKKEWGKADKKTLVTYIDRASGKKERCTISEVNMKAYSIFGKHRLAAWEAVETPVKKDKPTKLTAAYSSILNGIAKLAPRYNDKGNVIRWENETPKAATARVAKHKSLVAYAAKLGIKD